VSDFIIEDITTLDRSTLETWATCPLHARLKETSGINSVSNIAESGELIHKAIGTALKIYLEEHGALSPSDLAFEVNEALKASRPDRQPEAIEGMRASSYSWSRFICEQPGNAILRFDGGEGEQSGQLAHDITKDHRITSEVDLLLATDSPEMLPEVDYKTGHKQWTATDVKNSFQFQFHAVLIFHNYPEVNTLNVIIWNTRFNKRSCRCEFKRSSLPECEARILSAIRVYEENFHQSEPVAWPTREKCSMCDVAACCKKVDADIRDVSENPKGYLSETIRLDEIVSQRKRLMASHVDTTGQDITTPEGDAFGTCKPKTSRKPTKSFYTIEQNEEDAE